MNQEVVVITGATGALGSKAAHAFAARGHSLVLLDRDQDRLDSLTRDLNLPAERLFASVVDLRDGAAVHSTAEAVSVKFGRVHALIHLVGGWVGGKTLTEASAEDLEFMLEPARVDDVPFVPILRADSSSKTAGDV